jgi:hypothetical protein
MKSFRSFSLLLSSILVTMVTFSQGNPKPVDRLGIKGPVNFDKKAYNLNWSSHPTSNYYKQEYIPAGEDENKFKSMVMVEAATGAVTPKDAMDGKVAELKGMANANPFISYESFFMADKKEYILDFVITQNTSDNKSATIAERNVYRYKSLPGNNGVMLFAISVRSYGADTKNFLANIKTGRNVLVDKVKSYGLPELKIK